MWSIKSTYFDFVLTNCPSHITHHFLSDPLQVCLYPPVIKLVNWKILYKVEAPPPPLKLCWLLFCLVSHWNIFFPNPAFLANPRFLCNIYSATTPSFFILFFTSLLPTTYIKVLLNFRDVEHKVLKLKKSEKSTIFLKTLITTM